jgi:hypothetical protein
LSWYLPNIDPALAAATTPPLVHPTSSIRRARMVCADISDRAALGLR